MISVIIVFNTRFENYFTPYFRSLTQYEPNTQIIGMDTTEEGDEYNYARALNRGAKQAVGDWLVFSNDDVLCTGAFNRLIESFSPDTIYGKELRRKRADWGAEVVYLYGYVLVMHHSLFETVGPFDEFYNHAGLEDIDYCWRAQKMGFYLRANERLPFRHLADDLKLKDHRRVQVPGFAETRELRKAHFLDKFYGVKADA